jgi:broad specificity phosphatase PhoE
MSSSRTRGRGGAAASSTPRTLFQEAPKTIYLIRHGESLGQKASRQARTRDPSLKDCGLSAQGECQASVLPSLLGMERYRAIDHVVSSPLRRAVHTALLGFPSKPVFVHYDLFEMGSGSTPIPENCPRPLKQVLADVGVDEDRVDGTTLAAISGCRGGLAFPQSHTDMSKYVRQSRLLNVWPTLWKFCQDRGATAVAVVCHYHVIRAALGDPTLRPENAIPIECRLHQDGRLEVVATLNNPVDELTVHSQVSSAKARKSLETAAFLLRQDEEGEDKEDKKEAT